MKGAYTHAGPEIGVASTKAFTAQLTVLFMIGLRVAYRKGTISERAYREMLVEMEQIPVKVETALQLNQQIECISDLFKNASNFLYLGRGYNFPGGVGRCALKAEGDFLYPRGRVPCC